MSQQDRTVSPRFDIAYSPDERIVAWLKRILEGYESCLEFGCGVATYMGDFIPCNRKAGIELFEPYVEEARATGNTIYHGDATLYEGSPSADVGLFIDSLEHLHKGDALRLIQSCKNHFKRIGIFCPEGHHENPKVDDNELNLHLSEWTADELRALGFEVKSYPQYHFTNPPEKQAAMFAVWTR